MKKRGHTRDCLDAAEAYLPCICGVDEHNKKVDLMTTIESMTDEQLRESLIEMGHRIWTNDGRLTSDSSADLDYAHDQMYEIVNELNRRASANPLDKIAEGFFATSVKSGFWPDIERARANNEPPFGTRNFGEMIALAHSELSEALEEHRSGLPFVYENTTPGKEGKPEGIAVELVDCMIRCFDTLASMKDANGLVDGYTIDELFALKGEYNKGREAKHGRAY